MIIRRPRATPFTSNTAAPATLTAGAPTTMRKNITTPSSNVPIPLNSVSDAVGRKFPRLEVVGNMVPAHLLPFKIHENKYIDSRTNKYTLYPTIGAFEIVFQDHVLFSKKDTNNWPSIPHVLHKINGILNPNDAQMPPPPPPKKNKSPRVSRVSPNKQTHQSNATVASETRTEKAGGRYSQSMRDSELTVHPSRVNTRENLKGFTLTDHFKHYRQKAPVSDKEYMTEESNELIESRPWIEGRDLSSNEGNRSTDRNRGKEMSGDGAIRDMMRKKGAVGGAKREMVINLDSIEEENGNEDMMMSIRKQERERNPMANQRMHQLENEMRSL